MIVIPLDDLAWEPKPGTVKSAYREAIGVRIDNEDGDIMFVAEKIKIDIEEVSMSDKRTYIQELSHALKITWPILALIIGSSFTFFWLIQNRIDASRESVQMQITEAKADISTVRSNSREDFNKMSDKLDASFSKLNDKIDALSAKNDEKLDKISQMINDLKVDQAKKP